MHLKPYPEYKNTHLSWIDVIPKHWSILRAKHVFKSIDIRSTTGQEELLSVSEKKGVTPRKNLNVTMFQAESYIGYKLCWPGDLVINSLWAWMQGLGFSKYHGIISSAYGVYRLKKELADDYRFFDYLIRSKAYLWELRVKSKGIWRSRYQLTDDSFFSIPIIIPPGEERKRIVRFLDFKSAQISRLIRAKRRIIELFKEQKQAIINQAVTRGLDPNVKLKPSGVEWLGEIPEHWEVLPLKRVTLLNPSKTETKMDNSSEEKVVFLPMEKISVDGSIDCSELLPFKQVCNGFTYFRKGDVIIAKITPCFENGKGAFLNKLATDFGFGTTELIVLRPGDKMLGQYLRLILSSKQFLTIGAQFMTGSAGQKRIPTEFIMNYIVPLPSIEEQIEICNIIGHKSEKIDFIVSRTEREISLMREYRARLIADVVTGKVDVRDIEVPDVTEEELIIEDRDEMEDAEESVEEAEDEE